jgi:hypothetical protein
LLAVAAGVVFYGLLALFPAVTAFVSLCGFFAQASSINEHLAVKPQDVVLGQAESADGCLTIDTCAGPVPVVAMQPGRQFGFSLT